MGLYLDSAQPYILYFAGIMEQMQWQLIRSALAPQKVGKIQIAKSSNVDNKSQPHQKIPATW